MPSNNYAVQDIDEAINTIFRMIFKTATYIINHPIQCMIMFLLISQSLRVKAQTTEKNSLDLELYNPNDISSKVIREKVNYAIEKNEWEETEKFLNEHINLNPTDLEALSEQLLIKIYREYFKTDGLETFSEIEHAAEQLLKDDDTNEIAQAVFTLNLSDKKWQQLPEKKKLRYAWSYFARAYHSLHNAELYNNPALAFSGILDLHSAIASERNLEVKIDLFQRELKKAYLSYSEIANDYKNKIDFSTLPNKYTLKVDINNLELFSNYRENCFNIATIKEAIRKNLPLLLNSNHKLFTSHFIDFKKRSTSEASHKPFVLLFKSPYFHIYEATSPDVYQLMLTHLLVADKELTYQESDIKDDLLEKLVCGIIAENGAIITDQEEWSRVAVVYPNLPKDNTVAPQKSKNSNDKSKKRKDRKPVDDDSIIYIIMGIVTAIISVIFIKKLFRENHIEQKDIKIKDTNIKEEKLTHLNNSLLEAMNEMHQAFGDSIWSFYLGSEHIFLVTNFNFSVDKLETPFLSKKLKSLQQFLKNAQTISIDKKVVKDLWLNKLATLFGKDNILQNSQFSIQIKIDHTKMSSSKVQSDIKIVIKKFYDEVVKFSPEYRLHSLSLELTRLTQLLEMSQHKYERYLKEQDFINDCQIKAQSYLNNNQYSAIHAKARENVNLCVSLKECPGQVNSNLSLTQSLISKLTIYKEARRDLQISYTWLNNSVKKDSFSNAINKIEAFTNEIENLQIKIKSLHSLLSENDDKLNRLYEDAKYLNLAHLKLTSKHLKDNKLVSVSVTKKTTQDNKIKNNNNSLETAEEKALRLKKYKEAKQQQEADKLKKKTEEQAKLRKKKEAEKNVKLSIQKAEKKESLIYDPLLNMAEHQAEMISQALTLNKDPAHHELLLYCSGNKKIFNELIAGKYKEFVKYIILMGMIKSMHSLGQITLAYNKFSLLEIKPYIIRNILMHKFWKIHDFNLVIEAATEFSSKFPQIIAGYHSNDLSKNPKMISMSSLFFTDECLNKIQVLATTEAEILGELDHHFKMICFMDAMIFHLSEKNDKRYFDDSGLLHQAVTSCLTLIGALLDELKKINPETYKAIQEKISSVDTLNENSKSIYQSTRIKVGHYFNENDSDNIKVRFQAPWQDIYKEVSPEKLRIICRDTNNKLYPSLSDIFKNQNSNSNNVDYFQSQSSNKVSFG